MTVAGGHHINSQVDKFLTINFVFQDRTVGQTPRGSWFWEIEQTEKKNWKKVDNLLRLERGYGGQLTNSQAFNNLYKKYHYHYYIIDWPRGAFERERDRGDRYTEFSPQPFKAPLQMSQCQHILYPWFHEIIHPIQILADSRVRNSQPKTL